MEGDDQTQQSNDYDRPVAYDVQGHPLYSHPATSSSDGESKASFEQPVDDDIRLKHDDSVSRYPNLGLSENEYVISVVRRHYIGLAPAFLAAVVLLTTIFSVMVYSNSLASGLQLGGVTFISPFVIIALGFAFMLAVLLVTYVSYFIFSNNKIYLTNESVFQTIQIGLFNKREQTISLQNIEDSSYKQQGLLQQLFDYGSIRLSTIGNENTYRLSYVANPKAQVDILNNAVESFKNGREIKQS